MLAFPWGNGGWPRLELGQGKGVPDEDWLLGKNFVPLVQGGEEVGEPADAFGSAQPEKAAGLEGEVEHRHELLLRLGLQVDEQVAATDQVQPRKWRIGED